MAEKQTGRKDPKEYMRLAVEVMKKSIPERKRNDPAPFVGAVLVFPDGHVETAFRGELREGDHAEYTVMDKKNRNRDLTGCWLFATLEPCAPGSRNAPKVSCAERIVNARISDVWFGIEDKNPIVDHAGIDYLLEHGVKVHQFSPEFHKEIEKVNKDFMQWANIRNEKARQKRKTKPDILKSSVVGTDKRVFSDQALNAFIQNAGRDYEPGSEEHLQEMKEMGLLEFDNESQSYIPTGNAVLLFGKNPRHRFPQACVKARVNFGDGNTDVETFDAPLVLIPGMIEDWLKKVLPASLNRSSFQATKVPSYPIEVIREAVVNAIVHRDYSIEGAKVQLEVNPDKIIIKSPGAPVPPVTIEDMAAFRATSLSRNKLLTFIFNEMHLMEETGLGMETFKSLKEKYNLPLPVFSYDGLNVVVTLPRNIESLRTLGPKTLSKLNEEELAGYDWIRTKGKITRLEYEKKFGFNTKKAERHLTKMVKNNLIRRIDKGNKTYYEIITT